MFTHLNFYLTEFKYFLQIFFNYKNYFIFNKSKEYIKYSLDAALSN